ncbi:Crp/Fnr family transcriptional regulator [Listeria aquatica]|uniref:Crp/Fnr family transcriptional regulator n=1 Tax=Listeria aquatica TaxID=1494960 RepID=UPI003F6F4272
MSLEKELEETDFDLFTLLQSKRESVLPYSRVHFKRGETIITEGEQNQYFYIILDGAVSMNKGTCREDIILSFLGKGEQLGFFHLVDGSLSPVSYEAVSEVSAYRFESSYVREKLAQEKPDLFLQLANQAAFPAFEREAKVHLPSDEKILAGLIIIGKKFGRLEEDDSCLIPYFFTQKILGNYLNLARAYVATNLRKLEEEGILALSPKPWRIYQFKKHAERLKREYNLF